MLSNITPVSYKGTYAAVSQRGPDLQLMAATPGPVPSAPPERQSARCLRPHMSSSSSPSPIPGFIFVHAPFLSKKGNVHLFSSSIPHFDKCHGETSRIFSRQLSRLLPVPGVLVSFLELHFEGEVPLLALRGRPQPLSKSPLKVKRDIFTRK